MWCLKTFFHYSGLRTRLIIHEDGTLTEGIIQRFLTHFKGCTIIRKREADIEIRKHLRGYPFCLKFRFEGKEGSSFVAIRLFDFPFFSQTNKIINLDSDILFFKKPVEIIEYMKTQQGFFMSDYQDAYVVPVNELNNIIGIKLRNKINAGMFYIPGAEYYDMDLLESFIKTMYECHYPISGRIEQTGFAMLFSQFREAFARLPGSYQISKTCITEETVSHHFVNDGSRTNFYKEGLKQLKKSGFIREINKTY
jgi:lipopolysaccharide biosynthesis glycosyltransferase